MYRYYLAQRFMISRPINLLGMCGVMLGVWALIVVVSIFDGYRVELRDQFTMTTSDMTVQRFGPRITFDLIRETMSDRNIAAVSPRIIWNGMIHPRSDKDLRAWLPGAIQSDGRFATIMGIDPALESKTTNLANWLSGTEVDALRTTLDTLKPGGDWILVSQRKAKAKKLEPGHDITTTIARIHYHRGRQQTAQFLAADFEVAGAYKTRHAGFDNLTVLVSIDKLRQLISRANSGFVNEVAVKLHDTDPVAVQQTRARLRSLFAARPEFQLATPSIRVSGERESSFLQAIAHQGDLMKLVLFVIMIVAGFLVYATLSMMVTEKKHDIGVLTALGGTRMGVMQIFLTSGFAISLVGTLLGVASGCVTSIYLDDFNELLKSSFGIDLFPSDIYNLPGVPYYLDPIWILMVVAGSLALGVLVSLLPAWRAMRDDPLTCLRDQ